MSETLQGIIKNVLLWKRKYGSIFYVNIGEREYVFKVLSRGEYLSLLTIQDKFEIDIGDIILQECLIYPKFNQSTFDKMKAGDIDGLIHCISDKSGFSKSDQIINDLEEYRSKIGTLDNQIIVLICKAFPHLTLQDINNLTYEDILKYLTISEEILGAKLNIEKPKPSKPGVIDFNEENKVMGATPFVKNILPPTTRGDASN